jgi:hypothetical protein
VFTVGDGERPITPGEISKKLREAAKNGLATTIVVLAHGSAEGNDHVIDIDRLTLDSVGRSTLDSLSLFGEISRAFDNRPVDVYMVPCHGGLAAKYASHALPLGSTLVTAAPHDGLAYNADLRQVMAGLSLGPNPDLSARGLLMLHLARGVYGLQQGFTPTVTVTGDPLSYDLRGMLLARLGRKFSFEEKQTAYDRLSPLVPQEDRNDFMLSISLMMEDISAARDLSEIYNQRYGLALAIMMVLDEAAVERASQMAARR